MRTSPLLVVATLALLPLSWVLIAPTDSHASQHAPIGTFATLIGPVEILIEDVVGPDRYGVPDEIIDLYTVPFDQTLVITDIQARAAGGGAWVLRDGQRVAEATHVEGSSGFITPQLSRHTAHSAGIEFPPGSTVQLAMPVGYVGTLISLRGHSMAFNPSLTSIHYP